MKAKLVYRDITINGRPDKAVTLRSVRTAFASSLPKVLAARGQNSHADPILWQEELGIIPVIPDGKTRRTCLIASQFHNIVDKRGWVADDISEKDLKRDNENDENDLGDDEVYDTGSVNSVLLQVLNQKLDFIISELGCKFVLDDSKLIKLA